MIVGNGLIASAFVHAGIHSPHHVIFASGVSNSTETRPEAYQRELSLLSNYVAKSTTIVYFSTTSIFDPTKQDSIYIHHKKRVEEVIQSQAESFIIVRLPIMIGHTSNPNTLINFLVNAILSQTPIQLHSNACRHLLDVDDLVPLLSPFLSEVKTRRILNIPGSPQIKIPDLVREIENVLHIHGQYSWQEAGACYPIPAGAGETVYVQKENYIRSVLQKYFGSAKSSHLN